MSALDVYISETDTTVAGAVPRRAIEAGGALEDSFFGLQLQGDSGLTALRVDGIAVAPELIQVLFSRRVCSLLTDTDRPVYMRLDERCTWDKFGIAELKVQLDYLAGTSPHCLRLNLVGPQRRVVRNGRFANGETVHSELFARWAHCAAIDIGRNAGHTKKQTHKFIVDCRAADMDRLLKRGVEAFVAEHVRPAVLERYMFDIRFRRATDVVSYTHPHVQGPFRRVVVTVESL
ncbi:MAG: hypothetical protein MHM6MM_006502 [Cercozoa sp. M6MM]